MFLCPAKAEKHRSGESGKAGHSYATHTLEPSPVHQKESSAVLQKQKDAKLAKMATRRMIMQKLRRTPDQHSKALAKANAVRKEGSSPRHQLDFQLFL